MRMSAGWKRIATLAAITLLGMPSMAAAKEESTKYGDRLTESKQVFQELMTSSDHKVPDDGAVIDRLVDLSDQRALGRRVLYRWLAATPPRHHCGARGPAATPASGLDFATPI